MKFAFKNLSTEDTDYTEKKPCAPWKNRKENRELKFTDNTRIFTFKRYYPRKGACKNDKCHRRTSKHSLHVRSKGLWTYGVRVSGRTS